MCSRRSLVSAASQYGHCIFLTLLAAHVHPATDRDKLGRFLTEPIAVHGRSTWRGLSGYTRQSSAEHTMRRFKWLFGGQLWARSLATHCVEAVVKCATLTRMTHLGLPETVPVG